MDEVENSVTEEVAIPQETNAKQETPVVEDHVESLKNNHRREIQRKEDLFQKEIRKRDELLEKFATALTPKQVEPLDELDSISDDEYIPAGKVKKLLAKAEKNFTKSAEDKVEQILFQRDQKQFLTRLKSQFSDFNEIVNPETLAIFEETDPELAQAISENKDPYKAGLQTYKYLKASRVVDKVPESRREKEVERILEKNAKTVQSPQAYDKRPIAQALDMGRLSKEQLASLNEEMNSYARMAY